MTISLIPIDLNADQKFINQQIFNNFSTLTNNINSNTGTTNSNTNTSSFAYIQTSGNAAAQTNNQAWGVLSGLNFSTISSSDFTVITGNPHSITYNGNNPIYVSIIAQTTLQVDGANYVGYLGIAKNSYTNVLSYGQAQAYNSGALPFIGVNLITQLNHNDVIQAVCGANSAVAMYDRGFQMSITKL